jgi:hypothetical protein
MFSKKSPLLVWKSKVLHNVEIDLTAEDLTEVDKLFPQPGAATGARHS